MARNTTVEAPAGAWVELTNANASSITFQNVAAHHVMIKGGATSTLPTDLDGALRYNPGQGERNVSLSDLFPGISAVRVFAFAESGAAVAVSHA